MGQFRKSALATSMSKAGLDNRHCTTTAKSSTSTGFTVAHGDEEALIQIICIGCGSAKPEMRAAAYVRRIK
jgi:hypothetical protein